MKNQFTERFLDKISRRRWFHQLGAVTAPFWVPRIAHADGPRAVIDTIRIISQEPHLYHGWPTLARRTSEELLLVYSGGREAHICPFGRVEMMRSSDGGKNWSRPQVLLDGPIDDRDAGVLETSLGTILVTTFSSLAYEPILEKAEQNTANRNLEWPAERLSRWQSARDRLDKDRRVQELGVWMRRSEDGGTNWSLPYRCLVNSPHGPVQLADGRLLYAGKQLWAGGKIGVCESTDDGRSWQWLAEIPTRIGDSYEEYHELHAVEAPNGVIIVQIRNHNPISRYETLQCESHDGGKTWTPPHSIGVWGYPSHLLRLQDGRLLMTYGHRRAPLGNQARISDDEGRTWSEPIAVSADGTSGDFGYPSTVQLDDGSLVTVWYELMQGSKRAVLRQANWQLTST